MCLLVVRLPLFYLLFFKIPKEVNSTLEGIQRIFLWGANNDNKKDCWGEMRHDLQKQKNERIRGKFFLTNSMKHFWENEDGIFFIAMKVYGGKF